MEFFFREKDFQVFRTTITKSSGKVSGIFNFVIQMILLLKEAS